MLLNDNVIYRHSERRGEPVRSMGDSSVTSFPQNDEPIVAGQILSGFDVFVAPSPAGMELIGKVTQSSIWEGFIERDPKLKLGHPES